MTNEQALLRLAASTSDAIRGVLDTIAPGAMTPGPVDVAESAASGLAGIPLPAIAADVSYVDGVNGGNLMAIGVEGARRLAATMMGADPDALEIGGTLDEIEMSAVGEAMNQMMSAAAMATSEVLGEEVEIAPPVVREIASAEEALVGSDTSGHACTVQFTLCGVPCMLVQLIPHAFVMRVTRAYDELTPDVDESAPLSEGLLAVDVRVWAELGRTKMPSGRAATLPSGAVVELDRELDAPIDLYADGLRFATGRLLVAPGGGLVVRIEALLGREDSPENEQEPAPEAIKEVA